MEIADRCVASFNYKLTDNDGQLIDTSEGRAPLAYLHGAGNIVPGLEKELAGKTAGDSFKAEVPPELGYGQHNEAMVQELPSTAFQGVDEVKPGMQFQAQGPQGPLNVMVTKVADDTVTVDGNHPLAGKTLHFDVEVTEVREATSEELEQGHVAMPAANG
ncbi:MAG: peptidylprolyl isomerase [Rhodanobacteraceae bacterium]